jgi:protein O-mannosyl-transferase
MAQDGPGGAVFATVHGTASPPREPRWALPVAAATLVLATLAAYAGSLDGPLIFDDLLSIPLNPPLRDLFDLRQVLSPPGFGLTVQGRPLLNLSLALDLALHGPDVRGFHVVNLLIHAFAALALLGVVRRTLRLPGAPDGTAAAATPLALAVALLWALHPLQTESVTYVIQRAESLAGLLYLATLYLAIRGVDGRRTWAWHLAAVATCLLGMAAKEVMVSAPLLVALHDRTFAYGSWCQAFRARRWLYAGLAATWILLAWLVVGTGNRGGTAGLTGAVGPLEYLGTQAGAITRYLRLGLWPDALVLDYGTTLARGWDEILPGAVVVGSLGVLTVAALFWRPAAGFLGAAFFLLLAPTSSVVPVVTQVAAEHRMYLPLATVVTLVVLGAFGAWRRRTAETDGARRWALPVLLGVAVAAALGTATAARNRQYASAEAIWRDTAEKRPGNIRARYSYGSILADLGDLDGALAQDEAAVALVPDSSEAHGHLGAVLVRAGRVDEGLAHLQQAVALRATNADAQYDLGLALDRLGRTDEALAHWEAALQAWPYLAGAHHNLGVRLLDRGRLDEAIAHLEQEMWLAPGSADARGSLGYALSRAGRLDEALEQDRVAVRLEPDSARRRYDLALVLALAGRMDEAAAAFGESLARDPSLADAECGLGTSLAALDRVAEAISHWERGLALGAASDLCRKGLARARGIPPEAPSTGPVPPLKDEVLRLAVPAPPP